MEKETIENISARLLQEGEQAFIKTIHEKLRETLTDNEKTLWINGYVCGLTDQKIKK